LGGREYIKYRRSFPPAVPSLLPPRASFAVVATPRCRRWSGSPSSLGGEPARGGIDGRAERRPSRRARVGAMVAATCWLYGVVVSAGGGRTWRGAGAVRGGLDGDVQIAPDLGRASRSALGSQGGGHETSRWHWCGRVVLQTTDSWLGPLVWFNIFGSVSARVPLACFLRLSPHEA
jgi:hypothetical protein